MEMKDCALIYLEEPYTGGCKYMDKMSFENIPGPKGCKSNDKAIRILNPQRVGIILVNMCLIGL